MPPIICPFRRPSRTRHQGVTVNEGRRIAVVKSYDELLAALRARALELGATRKQIAEVAGLPDGYAATLLAPQPIRALGRTSLGPMLGALGLMLVVVEDEEAWARVKSRVGGGKKSFMLNGVQNSPVIFKLSRRHMRKLGLRSGAARMKKLPAWKRRAVARKAARARWAKARAAPPADSTPAAAQPAPEPPSRHAQSAKAAGSTSPERRRSLSRQV